jgi:SAM-dependent methyltransferase
MGLVRDHGQAQHFDYYTDRNDGLVEHYEQIGPREGDIALAFALAGNPEHARVLELGCGQGREAQVILQRTPYYLGIDRSPDMIRLARKRAKQGFFEIADVVNHTYDQGTYDIVFAFGLLRHLDKQASERLLAKLLTSLRVGGVLYLSSPYGSRYKTLKQHGFFGVRQVALYSPKLVAKLAGKRFAKVYELMGEVSGEPWFEIALQKKS